MRVMKLAPINTGPEEEEEECAIITGWNVRNVENGRDCHYDLHQRPFFGKLRSESHITGIAHCRQIFGIDLS